MFFTYLVVKRVVAYVGEVNAMYLGTLIQGARLVTYGLVK